MSAEQERRATGDAFIAGQPAEDDLVSQVEKYAVAHYTDGGWDVVVECYDRAEIREVLDAAGAGNLQQAVAAFKPYIDVWSERQADARNSAF